MAKSVEDRIADLAGENADWRSFMETPQWKAYATIIRGQIVTRRQELNHLLSEPSQDNVIKRLAKDHEIAGLQLALAMPELLIKDNEVTIETFQLELDEENGYEAE